MRDPSSGSMVTVAIAAAAFGAAISASVPPTLAQTPAPKTPWGEPDLQGIWTDETDTPLQRSPKSATQEFFTPAQRAALDKGRSALLRGDRRVRRGTGLVVAGAYNGLFFPQKHPGARTSRIADPPDGRRPPLTPQAQKPAAADREFRLAL